MKNFGKIHDDFVKVFMYAVDCKKMGTSQVDLPSEANIYKTAGFIDKMFKELCMMGEHKEDEAE